MSRFGDADRDLFLGRWGVEVVCGAYHENPGGILDDESEGVLPGHVIEGVSRLRTVRVKTGAFTPEIGGAIEVDGTAYVIRDVRVLGPDGAFTRIWLEDAA